MWINRLYQNSCVVLYGVTCVSRAVCSETERGSKFCGECFGRVAHDWQTGTLRRAVQRECSDDRLSVRLQNALQTLDVARTIRGVGEEVKDRAIVPR